MDYLFEIFRKLLPAVGASVVGVVILFFVMAWIERRTIRLRFRGKEVIQQIAGVVVAMVIAAAVEEKDTLIKWLTKIIGLYGARAVIAALVMALGFMAYLWKKKNQRSYGMGEAVFGSVAGIFIVFAISPGQSLLSQWVGLAGCSYVIARGLNNVSEAREKVLSRVTV